MALVTRVAQASADTSSLRRTPEISGDEFAGEALDAVAAVYKKASDGLWYMSNGTAANEAATCWGFTPRATASGQPVTVYKVGARFRYGSGLTIGAKLYVATTAGRLGDAASTGGTVAVARVITATDIEIIAVS